MVSILILMVYIVTVLLFISIKSDIIREKRKRRNQIAEFDINTKETIHSDVNVAKKISDELETQLGHGYELLGHKMSDFGSELQQDKNNLAKEATDLYTGPLADKTSVAFENFQNGYGKMGDGLSSILSWLGENVIKLGHNTGSIIRSSFHAVGDIIGDTVDKTEHFIGKGLIKSGEKVHIAGAKAALSCKPSFFYHFHKHRDFSIPKSTFEFSTSSTLTFTGIDLQRTSHNDSENFRHKFEETAPKFEQSVNDVIGQLGDTIHTLGLNAETAGEIIEQHKILDTIKQAYHD